MIFSRQIRSGVLVPGIFLITICLSCGSGANTFISKKYPEGFSLKHPKTWQAKVVDKSFIWISNAQAEDDASFILVYPFFLRESAASRSWLSRNLNKLSQFFEEVVIEKNEQIRNFPDEAAAKFRFERNKKAYKGIALCSILENSGIVYVMASPEDEYENRKDELISIVETFRFEELEKDISKIPQKSKIPFTAWNDPMEGAFNLNVPKGWNISGGTFRRASVDLVHFLEAVSPDQKIRIQFNDSNLPIFAIPNQTLFWAGFGEGSWYSPGYGVRMLVKKYTPGYYFLNEYLQQNYIPQFRNFTYVSQKDRPDVVSNFNRIYSQFAPYGISFMLHAGEAAFKFEQNSESYVGYGLALTQVVQSAAMQGGNWSVALLLITTCPETEAENVRETATHMFQSIRVNPQWAAAQQQLAANVSQIVTQTSQEISRIINESYWTRQAMLDDVNRKFSNYILGVTDVVDPLTGDKWKVEAGHNYYWRKDYTSQVVGTQTAERPDINFSLLKEF